MTYIKAILWDCDLVLVNSDLASFGGACDVFTAAGLPTPTYAVYREQVKQPFINYFRENGITMPESELWSVFCRKFKDLSLMTSYAGMSDCLAKLQQTNLPLGVISSASNDCTELKLKHFGLSQYFTVIDGGEPHKAPVIKRVCERFGIPPDDHHRVVFIGDMTSDIIEGRLAGVTTIGLVGPHADRIAHQAARADIIADSHAHLYEIILSMI